MKAIKILIFVIIGILIIGIGIGAYIYFYTDTFKTNKEIFYKYASKEQLAKIIDFDSINQTLTRLESEKSEQNIDATINMTISDQNVLNNATISLKGKADPTDNKSEVSLIFGNNNKKDVLQIDGIYNEEKAGISFKDITNKYIAVNTKDLNALSEKIDLNEENIDEIDFSNYKNQIDKSIENVKVVLTEFFTKMAEQTSKEQYSNLGKTQIELNGTTVEAKVYELKLNSEEIKNIWSSINIGSSDTTKIVDDLKESMENSKFDFSQTIYVYEEKLAMIEFKVNSEDGNAKITKNLGAQNDKLTIEVVPSEETQIAIDILKTSNEKYVMNCEITGNGDTENKILININVDIKFDVNDTIEELTDKNSVIINDMSTEELEKIQETIVRLVKEREGIEDTVIGLLQSITEMNIEAKNNAIKEAENASANLDEEQQVVQINGVGSVSVNSTNN